MERWFGGAWGGRRCLPPPTKFKDRLGYFIFADLWLNNVVDYIKVKYCDLAQHRDEQARYGRLSGI